MTAKAAVVNRPGIIKRRKFIAGRVVLYTLLTLVTVAMAFPFLWMMSSALKTKDEVMNSFSLLPKE